MSNYSLLRTFTSPAYIRVDHYRGWVSNYSLDLEHAFWYSIVITHCSIYLSHHRRVFEWHHYRKIGDPQVVFPADSYFPVSLPPSQISWEGGMGE